MPLKRCGFFIYFCVNKFNYLKQKTMKSKFLSINWHDLKKGLLIAVLTPVLVELQSVWRTGSFGVSPVHLAAIGASGLVAYLLKNLFEGEK